MKRYSVILASAVAACAVSTSASAAWYEGWFDWFTPGEWSEGTTGFYAGGALDVTRATDPRFQRRIGGYKDPGPDGVPDSADDYTTEPVYNSTGFLKAGWKPFGWLDLEARAGTGLEEELVAEYANPDSPGGRYTSYESTVSLDMIYGVYAKPQLKFGPVTLFGTAGYSGFEYSLTNPCAGRDSSTSSTANPCSNESGNMATLSDSGFAWGGGVQLNTSAATSIAFEYTNHFDSAENRIYGIGVTFSWFFLNGGGGDDYY